MSTRNPPLPALAMVLALALAACAAPEPTALAAPTVAAPASVRIDGDLPRPATLTIEQLEQLGPAQVEWSMHGDQHAFRCVPVHVILEHLGFAEGPGGSAVPPAERRAGWRCAVVATTRDGYRMVFSAAELSPVMGNTRAFLAWAEDGAPLPAAEGPLRLIVPSDRKGARSVRQLVQLTVVDLKAAADPR